MAEILWKCYVTFFTFKSVKIWYIKLRIKPFHQIFFLLIHISLSCLELNKCLIILWQQIEYPVIVRHLGTIKVQLTLERESNVAEIKSQRRNSVPTRKGRGVALKDLSLSNLKYDSTIKCQSIQLTPTFFSVWPSVLVNEGKF